MAVTKAVLLAMIAIESGGNPAAKSPTGAAGLMQMTSIAEKEVCIQYGCPEGYDIWDEETNLRMGYQLASFYLKEARGSLIGMVILYNGGYVQYRKYLLGEPMAEETANYVTKFIKLRKHYATLFSRIPNEYPKHYALVDSIVADDPFDVNLLSGSPSY
jgi:trimeric autotransporter adhesin